jgi:diacylglycerol kinase family enzyme
MGRVTVIETVHGGIDANRALLRAQARQLGPHTLLCIAAGDGTVGMVVEMLVQDPGIPEKARLTPIFPLWGGNANDLAHMLNGNAYRNRVHETLTKGAVIAVHPLECALTMPDGTVTTRIAACYASFGATAFVAARLNEHDVRHNPVRRLPGGRLVAEFVAGFLALARAPSFTVMERGSEKVVYERTFTNGSRFAKMERLPLKLTDDAFMQHIVEEKQLHTVMPRLWRAMQKKFVAQFRENQVEFTVGRDIMAQFDGESAEIPAGTNVYISLASQPFWALSILLGDEVNKDR